MPFRLGILLAVMCLPALAQSHLYLFLAPGAEFIHTPNHTNGDGFVHAGGGGELAFSNGFGLGADAGVIGFVFGGTLGSVSTNGFYHFRRGRYVEPYVTGGYTVFFNSGHFSLGNFGSGANFWFSSRAGAKLEFRDHIRAAGGATSNYPEFRMGIAFR